MSTDLENDGSSRTNRPKYGPFGVLGWSIITVFGLMAIILLLTFTVFIPNSVESAGNQKERKANTYAVAAFGAMDTCVQITYRSAQVTQAQADAIDKILKDAVSGRYGTGASLDQNKVFSLLQENYPSTVDISKLYATALSNMTGCQKDFLAAQTTMNTYANDFLAWSDGSWETRTFGGDRYPDDKLVVVIGEQVISGIKALRIMQRAVVETDTANAITSGTRSGSNSAGTNPFATPSPAGS
jgi:hypothetical protein